MRSAFRIGGFFPVFLVAGSFFATEAFRMPTVAAASYDYYVEDGADGDGSSDDPFGSVGDALEEIGDKGGDSVYVRKGRYDESFTIPDDVSVVGEDKNSVTVSGAVRMEDDTLLKGVTVVSGGVIVSAGADAEFVQVRIEDVAGIGINAEKGTGTVTVRECRIEEARKGLYIQAGRTIRMDDTEVEGNDEEGLDIRQNVSGVIEDSIFRKNGESGIEVILGSSEIVVRNNRITDNGASGIATQFVPVSKKTGDVRIEGNVIRDNDNHGIDCKIPQGGPDSREYFLNSLVVSGNDITGNGDGEEIARFCKIMTEEELAAAMEAEARLREAEDAPATATRPISSEELARRNQEAALERKRSEDIREAAERERVESVRMSFEIVSARLELEARHQASMPAFARFLYGDARSDRELREGLGDLGVIRERIAGETASLHFPENARFAESVLESADGRIAAVRTICGDIPPIRFSPFGWVGRLLHPDRSGVALSGDELGLSLFSSVEHPSVIFVGELSYHPDLRSRVIAEDDDAYFSGIGEKLSAYDIAVGTVTSPMLGDDDPGPASGGTGSLPIPSRFANIFSSRNIRVFGLSGLARSVPSGIDQTAAFLSDAGGMVAGHPSPEPVVIGHGEASVAVFSFSESDVSAEEAFLGLLDGIDSRYGATAVLLDWNPVAGTELTETREALLRRIADRGADLVVGSGVTLSGTDRISDLPYREIGNVFREAISGSEGTFLRPFIALTLDEAGKPAVSERTVSVVGPGELRLSEPDGTDPEAAVPAT